jgi:hypothetical protein
MLGNAHVPPQHVASWARKVQKNLQQWQGTKKGSSNAEKLEFIRQQYAMLALIIKALDGKVKFVGVDWSLIEDKVKLK